MDVELRANRIVRFDACMQVNSSLSLKGGSDGPDSVRVSVAHGSVDRKAKTKQKIDFLKKLRVHAGGLGPRRGDIWPIVRLSQIHFMCYGV